MTPRAIPTTTQNSTTTVVALDERSATLVCDSISEALSGSNTLVAMVRAAMLRGPLEVGTMFIKLLDDVTCAAAEDGDFTPATANAGHA